MMTLGRMSVVANDVWVLRYAGLSSSAVRAPLLVESISWHFDFLR